MKRFISYQIRVGLRDRFCKSPSVKKSNVFLNYLRNTISIKSWAILSSRHGMKHWEKVETEKGHIKHVLLDLLGTLHIPIQYTYSQHSYYHNSNAQSRWLVMLKSFILLPAVWISLRIFLRAISTPQYHLLFLCSACSLPASQQINQLTFFFLSINTLFL